MKELYWIDDDFAQMMYIAQGAISKLWELNHSESEGIRSKIIVFGNACMVGKWNELPSQREEDKAYETLFDLYAECCYALDGPNRSRPIYRAKRELIQDAVLYLLKSDQCEDQEIFSDIRGTWEKVGHSIQNEGEDRKATDQVKKLIERMNIPKEAAVGIDLSLLRGDIDRIRNEQKVISMELYRQLREDAFKCFLYSAEAGEIDFVPKWKQTFVQCYPKGKISYEESTDIKIYERKDFLRKGSEDVVSELRRLLDK